MLTLNAHADFDGWRSQARSMCAANIAPAQVRFNPPDRDIALLDFGQIGRVRPKREVKASSRFLELAERVACFNDPERYDRLYALLWRLQDDSTLIHNTVDDAVKWLVDADKAVRRDRHKMHAFVRFRKVSESESGREQFIAWFEPSHYIVDLASGFFARRFPNMDWAIITPYRSAIWNGQDLRFGPGGSRTDAPDHDVIEDQWKAYYSSIFNPSRVKISAMKAEMPVKYWKNLPEADLISSLIQTAHDRENRLMRSLNHTPNPIADKATYQPARPDIDERPANIPAIGTQIEACRRCPLWNGATQAVAGVGPHNARLMIVGEQPGDQEDLAGQPFIGPAGQILDQALLDAGLSRDTAYVTNAVKHFKYEVRNQRRIHKSPTVAEIKACNLWLEREIDLIQPELILCLGTSAARAVLGRPITIADQRGQKLIRHDGRAIMVTTHPAYVLRTQRFETTPSAFPDMVTDLQKVASLLAEVA